MASTFCIDPGVFGGLALLGLAAGCFVSSQPVCCDQNADCAAGAVCFEGRCALSCDDDAQCAEGEVCIDPAGACRAEREDAAVSGCAVDRGRGDDDEAGD